jgi:hypothetical protein
VRDPLIVAALSVGMIASGCSGDSGQTDDARIVRTGSSTVAIEDGRLTSAPTPVTFSQISEAGRNTAAAAVLSLYFLAQWGSIPSVVEMYHPRVKEALGAATIADGYVDQRTALLATQVVIRETAPTRLGTAVTVDAYTTSAPPTRDSFLLVRRNGRWYVAQDTVLERGLAAVVGARASQGLTGQAAIRRAQSIGGQAARSYRNLFLRTEPNTRPSRSP